MSEYSPAGTVEQRDVKIIGAIHAFGPRFVPIAKRLDMPVTSVRYRYQKMLQDGMEVIPNIDWEAVGYANFYVKGTPRRIKPIRDRVRPHLAFEEVYEVVYGKLGYCYFFVAAEDLEEKLESGLKTYADTNILKTSAPRIFPPDNEHFAPDLGTIEFDWTTWSRGLYDVSAERHTPQADAEESEGRATVPAISLDDVDKEVLRGLYKTHRLIDISRSSGIHPEKVKYRFYKHIKGLINGYEVLYTEVTEPNYIIELEFTEPDYLKNFISLCGDLPFVSKSRTLDEYRIISQGRLPQEEKWHFFRGIEAWTGQDVLADYTYNDMFPFSSRIYNVLI